MTTRYVVKSEHTLGYIQEGEMSGFMGILATCGYGRVGGIAHYSTDEIREATPADFERFRVCPKGHFPPQVLAKSPLWGIF